MGKAKGYARLRMNLHWSEKFGIGLCFLLATIVLIDVISREEISPNNTITIEGTFSRIEKSKPKRGSLSYNLYIQQKSDHFKIMPDLIDCFDYKAFTTNVSKGESIKIIINKDNGQRSPELLQVVSVIVKNRNYISVSCINNHINNSKIYMPIFFFSFIVLIGFLILKKRNRA